MTLCLILIFGSCSTGGNEKEKTVPAQETPGMNEPEKTHVGGCILASPAAEAPADLYMDTSIETTDAFKPFTKKLTVCGITLI